MPVTIRDILTGEQTELTVTYGEPIIVFHTNHPKPYNQIQVRVSDEGIEVLSLDGLLTVVPMSANLIEIRNRGWD